MSYVNYMTSRSYMSYVSYISYVSYANYMSIFMNHLKSNNFFTIYKHESETSKM